LKSCFLFYILKADVETIVNRRKVVYDNDMATEPWKYLITNSFGTLGYLSIIIQWTWGLITFGQPLLSADQPLLLPQAPIPQASHATDFGIFSPFVTLLALFITILVVVLTVVNLLRLPKAVGRAGAKTTHVVATQIVKKVQRHHPVPAKKSIKLAFWVVWLLKFIAVFIPLTLVFITPSIDGLSTQLITAIGVICAAFSVFYFACQFLLSLVLKLDNKKVW
jgi:hypothetical protein